MMANPIRSTLAAYETWLAKQPLSASTLRTYLTQVRQYCAYLEREPAEYGDPLNDPYARDYGVRDYKAHLQTVKKRRPTTTNLALAAIDHFYAFLQMEPANVARAELPQQSPRALDSEGQKRFLRAVERCPSARNRAVTLMLFYTGLRVGECSALDRDDLLMSARKGIVIVRQGKRGGYREVPLNTEVRTAQKTWLKERDRCSPHVQTDALYLSRQGKRLSTRAIDLLVRKLGKEAQLELSAHVLRHTCLTNLLRNGNDVVFVAEIAGHKRLETTRRYTLPSATEREAAMEALKVEY